MDSLGGLNWWHRYAPSEGPQYVLPIQIQEEWVQITSSAVTSETSSAWHKDATARQ